jgi:hypothetical protein
MPFAWPAPNPNHRKWLAATRSANASRLTERKSNIGDVVPAITIIFGVLLSVLGGVLFGLSDPDHRSITALIPTLFGVLLIILGIVARREKARMHAMHGAALVALIGVIVPGYRAMRGLLNGADFTLAISGQIIMALLCAAFLLLCIQSFIAARRARRRAQ